MMTPSFVPLALVLIFATHGTSAENEAEAERFTSELKAAILGKDEAKLEALIYAEGASSEDRQRMLGMTKQVLLNGQEVKEISLEPLPKDFESLIIVRGQKIEPTAPPIGMAKVRYQAGETASAYAVVEGRYFLVGMKSTALNWQGPPDKNLAFTVAGKGASEVQKHGIWNVSGVRREKSFQDTGLTFWGQHFEQFTVTSQSQDSEVTLTLTEDGKTIHTATLKGAGVLRYEKKP